MLSLNDTRWQNLDGGYRTRFDPRPLLSRTGVVDWNSYALVAVIELARDDGKTPKVPMWLEEDYFQAIRGLAEAVAVNLLRAKNPEEVRAILSILAISAGARTHAKFLVAYSAEQLLEIERPTSEVEP